MTGKFTFPTLAALVFTGVGAAQPLEMTGPCPELTRSSTYNGQTVSIQNPNWPGGRPPSEMLEDGQIQDPLTPQESVNCLIVPEGLKGQLVASELTPPDVLDAGEDSLHYLMHFTFDERGRVWAVDSRDYPYTHNEDATEFSNPPMGEDRINEGESRIVVLEDTNNDGALDAFKVFYEGLVIPTSIEVVNGGVVVTVPPYVLFIPNVLNLDVAGAPEILLSNMGSTQAGFDSHGQTNSLTMGLDNWIYGHTGYNGCGGNNVAISGDGTTSGSCGGGNIWRFKHAEIGSDTTHFEVYGTGGPANAHGIGQMEDGQWFKSGATCSSHSNHQVRQRFTSNIGASGTLEGGPSCNTGGAGDGHVYYPVTDDAYYWEGSNTATRGGFRVSTSTATTGHDFYTARLLPEKYWNRFSFVCDGSTKLCNMDSLVMDGSTWDAVRMPGPARSNLFSSPDAWTAPLKVRTGPEGGLWVLDWHNYLFLHNPAGPATNAAYRHPLRAKHASRLYRILPEDGSTRPVLNLTNASLAELVGTFWNENFLWRMQAQRLLLGKNLTGGDRDSVLNMLERVLTDHRYEDAVGIDGPALHALWTLHGLQEFESDPTRWDPILEELLLHPAWTVRRNVPIAMPATVASSEAIKEQCAVNDEHAHVRVQAMHHLSRLPAPGSGPIESVAGLRSDNHISNAYTSAGGSATSIEGSGRPGSCPAYADTTEWMAGFPADAPVNVQNGNFTQLRNQQVRVATFKNGFELMTPGDQVGNGELTVHDIRGKVVFRSTYDAASRTWSQRTAVDMNHPVYFYSFRGVNGDAFNGRIALTQAL